MGDQGDCAKEVLTKSCQPCQETQNAPAVAPLHPWLWPSRPWARVHIDFAGPFLNQMFLIIVDAHSKWPEVVEMKTTTAVQTIVELRKVFSAYSIPEQIVSDNGPQFVSSEFGEFYKVNGIKVAGTVLKHANYSLLAVTTIMQYAHTYVHVAVRLPALRIINARVHVRFHREAILPELAHSRYISRQAIREPVERQDRFWELD